jgi:hypothetical protein
MTDEEIDRFALVLKECERIRALIAREEAAVSNGEHDDGIPIAGYSPECVEGEFSEVSVAQTRSDTSSLRAAPYLAIQLLEDRLAVLVALLVVANFPKSFG